MSQEALLGEREGLASQLLSRRSIGQVFSLRRGKRRRLNSRQMQSESLDYHTIHNRASLRAPLLIAAVPTKSLLRVIVCCSTASLQPVQSFQRCCAGVHSFRQERALAGQRRVLKCAVWSDCHFQHSLSCTLVRCANLTSAATSPLACLV